MIKLTNIRDIAHDNLADELTTQSEYDYQSWLESDKLWNYITYTLTLVVLIYGVYQLLREFGDDIIRFLMM